MARSFCTKIAQFLGRKPRGFCVENFENQRARGRKRTQNAGKTLKQSLYACCAGRAGCPELCCAVCSEICGKTSRFSLDFAKVSMKFGALFAQHTRPAPSKMRKRRKNVSHSVQCMFAASAHVPRVWLALFAPKLCDFSVENRAIFALTTLKISAIAAADARRTPTKRLNNHWMHAAQVVQVIVSSAMCFAQKSAEKLHDFRLKSRKFR